jgi:hypothetical protein
MLSFELVFVMAVQIVALLRYLSPRDRDIVIAAVCLSVRHTFLFMIMIITNHVQNIIQIYPCLLKLSRKQRHNSQYW